MKTTHRIIIIFSLFFSFWTTLASASTYQIPIEVSVPVEAIGSTDATKAYNRLVLGVHPEATENYDPQWDTPAFFTTPDQETPPLLRAYIEHPEYAENRQQLWRDIRSASGSQKVWTVDVSLASSEIGKTVTVVWTLPPSLATSGERVTLSDPETQTTVDMRTQSAYRYVNSSSSAKTLSVTISSSPGSSDKDSSGFFGCGMVKFINSGSQDSADSGRLASVVLNLLILLSPILLRLQKYSPPRPGGSTPIRGGATCLTARKS